ncbi:PWWP domain-containing protein 2A-like isoform X2 [Chelonus insularis]|uniref:PWWP domain-containing protein 2A-like isoform X2 n=1 Tax=Chelonus insularis TaxID=460826 RepID=UPI00158B01D8|nr:PWWP domain-containing protein 2A-like isoform X2 [Chelonus insularis]
MAGTELLSTLTIAKGDQIVVTVESALPDIIVVSFINGVRSFQGALLDVNKKGLPCGINPPKPTTDTDGDKLSALAARFTYFQEPEISKVKPQEPKKNVNPSVKYKNTRPTVRLRPRQVLCNKCRSICNEKNENVDLGKKRKFDNSKDNLDSEPLASGVRRSERRIQQQSDQGSSESSNYFSSLIPKISRLDFSKKNDCSKNELKENVGLSWSNDNSGGSCDKDDATPSRLNNFAVDGDDKIFDNDGMLEEKTLAAADSTIKSKSSRRIRKKRSVGSMEDLWDETIFEDVIKSPRATPVIKISFGSQGEGTVLKIPSKTKNPSSEIDDNEEDDEEKKPQDSEDGTVIDENVINNVDSNEDKECQKSVDATKFNHKDLACAKAAKKALKKAKKEAQKKISNGGVSPARSPLSTSSRYNSTCDPPVLYHRRKHKDKHKKKHKEGRKQHKSQEVLQKDANNETKELNLFPALDKQHQKKNLNDFSESESYTAIKEQCLKQKLCISLRRLNANAYTRCNYSSSNTSSDCKTPITSSEEMSETEPDSETKPAQKLKNKIDENNATGRRMDVGDIVWGKIHGFPWWPGKVLSISVSCKEDGTSSGAQAHVAWYGSSTCSLMSCDRLSPFLETFKARYNKKKRGPYKEAIRQAQSEAQSQVSSNSISNVLNVCESPREVNVLS